jgi:hypothetical protein
MSIDANTTTGEILQKLGRPSFVLTINDTTMGHDDKIMPLLTGSDDIRVNPRACAD